MSYLDSYNLWCEKVTDKELLDQLKAMNDEQKEDAFYRNLEFGTGGLRGVIGVGTNRMNIYTVSKASQGLANYINNNFKDNPSIVIGYDSRIKSDVFAKVAAEVFAANGIKVNIWPTLNPVPTVSYATRFLKTSAGVMVTASHNPSKYNGYKVYGSDGCQITTTAAKETLKEIESVDIFNDVKRIDFNQGLNKGLISYIKDEVLTSFIEQVKNQSVLFGDEIDQDVTIVYSPLNGTGYLPVTRVLNEMGYTNVKIVEEQRLPDGNFPTCPYPNPEIKEALKLGIEYAKKYNADLLLATDPDCDRVGIAVKDKNNEYVLLSGNEVGCLLLDYICSQRIKHNKMPNNPVIVKTIVSMDLASRIADNYQVRTIDVLTGFKYIGEQIGLLEKENKEDSYIFGFEESYGYLSGSYVRDKDGVNGAYLISEMFAYYKKQGLSLLDKLGQIFDKYGYTYNTLHSYTFEGSKGFTKMQDIMKKFHQEVKIGSIFGDKNVIEVLDYSLGINNLPKSDVLKYVLEDNCSLIVRPSGTEPKLKTYISITAKDKKACQEIEEKISNDLQEFFK